MARLKLKLRAPLLVRQFLAECLGTFFLVLIGDASILQMQLFNKNPNVNIDSTVLFSKLIITHALRLQIPPLLAASV